MSWHLPAHVAEIETLYRFPRLCGPLIVAGPASNYFSCFSPCEFGGIRQSAPTPMHALDRESTSRAALRWK
ncbi:hypothetical protein CRG98_049473, partial [Punica granatum]